ncbi:MAG: motility associated factor glycosyltransferase family protein [Spirochaetaceae bacterium]|nr:motility associated factor glycosyltransferase family protein [Spirochaetaceae bacterium]
MSSIWNKNIAGFSSRFPQLYSELSSHYNFLAATDEKLVEEAISDIEKKFELTVTAAKNGEKTATTRGKSLHSGYNPGAEGKKIVADEKIRNCCGGVFFGFGLGYGVTEFAKIHKDKRIVAVEWHPELVFWAFFHHDFQAFFEHKNCVLLINSSPNTVLQILETSGIERYYFFNFDLFKLHSQEYFQSLFTLLDRNVKKKEINEATLEKFKKLWLRNFFRNLSSAKKCLPVSLLENRVSDLPAFVICAGPTLDEIAPKLSRLKNRCVTVCCDTALQFCHRNGLIPDFVVSTDAQYWNFCHIAASDTSQSVLITDIIAFPAIFRKKFAKTFLCSSLYPLAKFCESQGEIFGALGSGGSVATTAWDFVRFLGCNEIYIAGLDLSFPDNKTHFSGSTFEERAHKTSWRLLPAENFNVSAFFSGNPVIGTSTGGKPVVTDSRFSMYAWWFESHFEKHKDVKTFAVSQKGLKIAGMNHCSPDKILNRPEEKEKIQRILRFDEEKSLPIDGKKMAESIHHHFAEMKKHLPLLQAEGDISGGEEKMRSLYPRFYPLVSPTMKDFTQIFSSEEPKTAFIKKLEEKIDFYLKEGYHGL